MGVIKKKLEATAIGYLKYDSFVKYLNADCASGFHFRILDSCHTSLIFEYFMMMMGRNKKKWQVMVLEWGGGLCSSLEGDLYNLGKLRYDARLGSIFVFFFLSSCYF